MLEEKIIILINFASPNFISWLYWMCRSQLTRTVFLNNIVCDLARIGMWK